MIAILQYKMSSFTSFPRLSDDIRIKIWQHVLNEPRIIEMCVCGEVHNHDILSDALSTAATTTQENPVSGNAVSIPLMNYHQQEATVRIAGAIGARKRAITSSLEIPHAWGTPSMPSITTPIYESRIQIRSTTS